MTGIDVASWQFLSIVIATFASEDLACLTTGVLVREQLLNPALGVIACFVGIFVGDLGLWTVGRFSGRAVLLHRRLTNWRSAESIRTKTTRLRNRAGLAILASRFLPGARVPLYIGAGAVGISLRCFAFWTFLAALVWTPLIVLGTAQLGKAVSTPLEAWFGSRWVTSAVAVLLVYALLRASRLLGDGIQRAKLLARIARIWRWEFWPTWLFYLPVFPWIGLLALRYRSLTVWTAANPGIPDGGVVGESKYDILRRLPERWIVPSFLVPLGDHQTRIELFHREVADRGWTYPIILKPDASQRGAGLKLARTTTDVEEYLGANPMPVVAQVYHPGPCEAGVFYYRIPGEPRGTIFSITDKRFPAITGDGRSTLEELIWRHPRYRMQAERFLARHAAEQSRVLGLGERFALAIAGNHCQGTMFRDGAHLLTPELETRIDEIARHFSGFCFGRFDIRYTDIEKFRAGQDLAIVELNGVTSESTNIYDPSRSLISAYWTIYRQWGILFRIGNSNRRQGIRPVGAWELLRSVRRFYRECQATAVSD